MKEYIEQLRTRIDAMSLRERGLLFIVIIVVLALLSNALLFAPLHRKQQEALSKINTLQQKASVSEAEIQKILQRRSSDPNAENRRLEQQYTMQLAMIDKAIAARVHGLITPRQMPKVLQAVLERQTGLKLLHIENEASKPLIQPAAGSKNDDAYVGIYRHEVRLELEGDYLNTLAYLKALQTLPWVLYWDELDISTVKYPKAHILIVVHTLSLDKGWIGV